MASGFYRDLCFLTFNVRSVADADFCHQWWYILTISLVVVSLLLIVVVITHPPSLGSSIRDPVCLSNDY